MPRESDPISGPDFTVKDTEINLFKRNANESVE